MVKVEGVHPLRNEGDAGRHRPLGAGEGSYLSPVQRRRQPVRFSPGQTAAQDERDAKGLIVPRFGKKPENHVALSMTMESFCELLLLTRAHYQAWLSAGYARG